MRSLIIVLFLMPLTALSSFSQAERSDIRKGNNLYKEGKFTEAEVKYKQAEAKNVGSYEAAFNLGGALYKQQRYEDAAVGYAKLVQDGSDVGRQSEAFYNLGNTQMKMRKLDESIEAYKEALRRNPTDMQAKFNLAYAQKLKQEDDKKNDENKDQNKDQNKDNQDQNKDQNKDNQDQNKDNKDQNKDNKDKQDQKQDKQNQQQQQQKQDNERMLKAVQASEDKTKKKVDEKQAEAVGSSDGKNW